MGIEVRDKLIKGLVATLLLFVLPITLGLSILHLWGWDFSIPLAYGNPGADEVWQLVATKTLLDTGWVLENPFMGAPSISTWYANSASQISVLHQICMSLIGKFVEDAVKVQQYYFLLNFGLITASTYLLGRVCGIRPMLAAGVGVAFAFSSYRLNYVHFSYLANYFFVPLSLIPVYWIFSNKFAGVGPASARTRWDNLPYMGRPFFIGCMLSILTALSDGYYAFFYLLLLGFAAVWVAINSGLKGIYNLVPPTAFALLVIVTSLLITSPLSGHRHDYPHEANQDEMKSVTDAEIYSPSLKLLLAPTVTHRIESIADFAAKLMETGNYNRVFKYYGVVNLGITGSAFLVIVLAGGLLRTRRIASHPGLVSYGLIGIPCLQASAYMALFILLCSITGGIGSLIALVYPTIRAYERFPIFLLLIIYIGVAAIVSDLIMKGRRIASILASIATPVVVAIVILDQTPADLFGLATPAGVEARSERFLAERDFIAEVEENVTEGGMIYQYPYSQYLTNNKYYGWGQFGHLRAYLHSQAIKWSNGAAKGSFVDRWHEHKAAMVLPDLIREIRSVGFEGVLVDRLVIGDAEFARVHEELSAITGRLPLLGDEAQLAFWSLDEAPFRLYYADDFVNIERLVIHRPLLVEELDLPRQIERVALFEYLRSIDSAAYPITLDPQAQPWLFDLNNYLEGSLGDKRVAADDLRGRVLCAPLGGGQSLEEFQLEVFNDSSFDWRMGYGNYPVKLGVLVFDRRGTNLLDMRLPVDGLVMSGRSKTLMYNLSAFLNRSGEELPDEYDININLVQDANAWFPGDESNFCRVAVYAADVL